MGEREGRGRMQNEAQMVEGGIRARVGRAVACGWARAVGRREVDLRARTGPLVKRGVAHADAALETGRAHGCVGRLALWIIDRVRLLVARLEDTDLLAPPPPCPLRLIKYVPPNPSSTSSGTTPGTRELPPPPMPWPPRLLLAPRPSRPS